MPVISGFVNEKSMLEVISSIVNCSIANSITSVNDYTFLVSLASKAEVKEVCKMDTMKISTKDREYMLKAAPWTAELGADGKVTGGGIVDFDMKSFITQVVLERHRGGD